MLQMYMSRFNIYLFTVHMFTSLPFLCILGGIGVGIYSYGSVKLKMLRLRQREQMRMHPDEPVPALPEKERKSALAFEIAGFIVMLGVCLGMFFLGHFDNFLALFGFGS